MINHANEHEQRGLKQRVAERVHNGSAERERSAHADGRYDPTQMRHSGICRELLQIGLLHREIRRHDGRTHADDNQQPIPDRNIMEHNAKAQQQVNTCLDHGRSVQERRHGGGRSHRLRQPEVERELRRFGERGHCNQHRNNTCEHWLLRPEIRVQNTIEAGGASLGRSNRHRSKQREAAEKRQNQRADRTRFTRRTRTRNQHE